MNSQSFTARIGGRDYTLSAQDDPERLKRIADYLDRKIAEAKMHTAMNGEIAAVVAGLSVTEELFTAKDEAQRLRDQLYEITRAKPAEGASRDS
ncbi:MAG: cell division protein ZapA [Clostridia bacterium]|nr:cell division protein ZapA [Clostridia bacterium]MBQ6232261.1 cell division protein ZapA [Clostridia bacterium]